MKIKTSELTGAALDWAVHVTLGARYLGQPANSSLAQEFAIMHGNDPDLQYSTNWSQGGPIISEARISRTIDHSGLWVAYWTDGYGEEDFYKKWMQCDRSELVAGLRCFVASKLGDEVEIPEELT